MELKVTTLEGKAAGSVQLSDEIFGLEPRKDIILRCVQWQLNKRQAGTHKTKEKSEVSGAGRKLWRQKGTGRARIGSIRSPLWRHGGTVHGPKPRSYEYALPKKMLLGALRSALSAKLAEQKLTVVDAWSLDTHKTKALRVALDKLNAETTALLVAHGDNRNLELASRNLDGVKLSATNVLQPYDVLRHDHLVVSKDAAARLVRALAPDRQSAEAPHVESIAPAPAPKKEAAPKAAAKPAAKKPAAKKPATKKGKE